MGKKVRRFKFLREGLKSDYDGFQWELGKWHKTKCVALCHGFNCSERIIDAMSYVRGEILAEVEVRGKEFIGSDKSTHAEMRIVRAWKWTKMDSVALSVFSAELVLENFESVFPEDDGPRKAIEAAKKFLDDPTEKNISAALFASEHIIRDIAYRPFSPTTESALYACESAQYAADSACESANIAAEYVYSARSATIDKIESWFINRLNEMEEWKP